MRTKLKKIDYIARVRLKGLCWNLPRTIEFDLQMEVKFGMTSIKRSKRPLEIFVELF